MSKCIKCLNDIADTEKSCPICGTAVSIFGGLFSFYNKLALKLQCCGKLLTAITIIFFALDIILFDKLEFNVLMYLTLTMLWAGWLSGVYHLFTKSSKLELKNGEFTRISPFEKSDLFIRKYFVVFTTLYLSFLLVFTVMDFISK